jgi:PAS domain S-box-containing protein
LIEDFLLDKFQGIDIHHCIDGETAVDYLHNNEVSTSLILLDLHLPDMSGLELIEKILFHSSRIPVIVLTGYSDLRIAQTSLQLGVYDFLIKDEINPSLLHKSIEFAISRKRFIKQINDEKSNFESLFNFSPQPMWLLDSETLNILNANFSVIQKYGYPLETLRQMSFLQFHPVQERELIKQEITSMQPVPKSQHYTHILQEGSEIKVDIYFRAVKEISNNDTIVVQANDITETLNHISTIEIQNEKLKSIAWTQSHVVRAPISRILGIINLIEEHKESLVDVLFWLKQLRVSTNEMDDVVKKIVVESQHLQKPDEKGNIYN